MFTFSLIRYYSFDDSQANNTISDVMTNNGKTNSAKINITKASTSPSPQKKPAAQDVIEIESSSDMSSISSEKKPAAKEIIEID